MPTRQFRTLVSISGILGVVMLVTSFALNPGVPSGATIPHATAFLHQNRGAILTASWLQEIGSFLIIAFAVALVHLARATTRLAGWLTLLGGTILVLVSLIEVTFYILEVQGSTSGNPITVAIALALITAIQHAYSMLAGPAVFLPLGFVLLDSEVLPRPFAYLAFLLGGIFAVFGVLVLFNDSLQTVVNYLGTIQGLWFLAAGAAVLINRGKDAVRNGS
jgi:hypothetical protein